MSGQLSNLGYHLNKQRDAWMEQTVRFFTALETETNKRVDARAEETIARSNELWNKYWQENTALKKLLRDILVAFVDELSANPELHERVKASITF